MTTLRLPLPLPLRERNVMVLKEDISLIDKVHCIVQVHNGSILYKESVDYVSSRFFGSESARDDGDDRESDTELERR
jgi:hypothetical protein